MMTGSSSGTKGRSSRGFSGSITGTSCIRRFEGDVISVSRFRLRDTFSETKVASLAVLPPESLRRTFDVEIYASSGSGSAI